MAQTDPGLPQVFGRYLLVQRLSRGGMGEIFLAKHGLAGFEKLAVIKKVLPDLAADEQFISRFVDEAQVAIKLSHVNVAQVFEVGRVGDEYFLALEYVEGRDLRRILTVLGQRQHRMPADLALFIVRELANGLAYAHRRTAADGTSLGLVHCDISPPNVLVSFEGETKVIDFGIAKSAMRQAATDPNLGFGKFGYMAPEQLIRGGVVDPRTDIYAAGVVLFELLTATRLYEAGPDPDYRALARKVAGGEHRLPSDSDPALAAYDPLVATALRPRPDQRYQSAAELRDAIQHCLVAVNPTISTDQLGAYLRQVFADEMAAQRELHQRVASAHLADFQDQLHTQTISTVSFALAQLPAQAPSATGPFARHGAGLAGRVRSTGQLAAARRSTAAGAGLAAPGDVAARDISSCQQPPQPPTFRPPRASHRTLPRTTAIARIASGGPASTDASRAAPPVAQRRRLIAIAAGAAAFAIAAAALVRVATSDGARRAAPVVAAPRAPAIVVEPIPVVPTPARPAAIQAPPAAAPAAPPRDAIHRPAHKDARPALSPSPSREQLGQKFQQVRREYDRYKTRFGARLEKEWGELATFIQYMPADDNDASRREAGRRLDEFRGRMRE